jgi:hypothetical protein
LVVHLDTFQNSPPHILTVSLHTSLFVASPPSTSWFLLGHSPKFSTSHPYSLRIFFLRLVYHLLLGLHLGTLQNLHLRSLHSISILFFLRLAYHLLLGLYLDTLQNSPPHILTVYLHRFLVAASLPSTFWSPIWALSKMFPHSSDGTTVNYNYSTITARSI